MKVNSENRPPMGCLKSSALASTLAMGLVCTPVMSAFGTLALDQEGHAEWQVSEQAALSSSEARVTGVIYEETEDSFIHEEDFSVTRSSTEQGVILQYAWGRMELEWLERPGSLEGRLSIINQTASPIAHFEVHLLDILQPMGDISSSGFSSFSRVTLDTYMAHSFSVGEERLSFGLLSEHPPLRVALEASEADPRAFHLSLSGGVHRMDDGGLTFPLLGNARVEPGQALTIPLLLKTTSTFIPESVAEAVFRDRFYRETAAGPNWPDRRPIGMVFVSAKHTANNPTGLFWDENLDASDPEAVMASAMAYAERAVDALMATNAQGMIAWDIEGTRLPISYVGDPRMLPILNPAMDAVADAFFKVFTDAGLEVGVTLRPTQVYFHEESQQWRHGTGSHAPIRNPLNENYDAIWPENLDWWKFYPLVERFDRKIRYARERWGCRIFYIDTNGVWRQTGENEGFGWHLLSADIYRRLIALHPDILIIPELQKGSHGQRHVAYWGSTAPYAELDLGGRRTPDSVLDVYPGAFSAINISDGNIEGNWEELVKGVRRGDILLFRGWFRDGRNAMVKEIYDEAAE